MSTTLGSLEIVDDKGLQVANARIYLLSLLSKPGENRLIDILTDCGETEERA